MINELLKNKDDITAWLNHYGVEDYELVECPQYGYVVDVRGFLDLTYTNLKYFPVKFNTVERMDCSHNQLKSLYGAPNSILKNFNCANNNLENLLYSPHTTGHFDCSNNKLKTFQGSPKYILGSFNFSNNFITSLRYCPEIIEGDLIGVKNNITHIVDLPKKVKNIRLGKNPIGLKSFTSLKDLQIIFEKEQIQQIIEEKEKFKVSKL